MARVIYTEICLITLGYSVTNRAKGIFTKGVLCKLRTN
nr:MAG TPA: hypothetical protein [Caudoviricetes sp.]DAV78240.1 MAG TPA: hypothetical protein [Caudoviricetes sp.]